MLEYINGQLISLTPAAAVIEVSGIGYLVNITIPTYTAIEGQQSVRLLLHQVIREDQWTLYGFIDEDERSLFRLLIGVSGVGANTARLILSSLPAPQLRATITAADSKPLKAIKGIGAKTAERIIVDLKDKIKPTDDTLTIQALSSDIRDEALAALVMLGFPRPQSIKVLNKLFATQPGLKVEEAIKRALTMM